MVSGVEKYFQIARCFRDEDLRADRQPEFTQLDLEMSFVEEEDVFQLTEELYTGLVESIAPQKKLTKPFPRLTYQQAMDRYGSDKPDLRFGMEFSDVTSLAGETEFRVFLSTVQAGGKIKGIVAPGCGAYTGSDMNRLEQVAKDAGAAGIAHLRLKEGPSVENLESDDILLSPGLRMPVAWSRRLAQQMVARPGDLILLMAGPEASVNQWLNAMRSYMGERLGLIGRGCPGICLCDGISAVRLGQRSAPVGFNPPSLHLPRRGRRCLAGRGRSGQYQVQGRTT